MDCRKLHLLLFVCLTSSCSFAHAQNLVPNPSFEDYKKLNCEWLRNKDLSNSRNFQKDFDSLLYSWVTPTVDGGVELFSTLVNPDCYKQSNICNTSIYCTTNPISIGAYPKDGDNICLIEILNFYKSRFNGRSYLQTPLKNILTSGAKYLAGFYTMLPSIFYGDYACNNFGLCFSSRQISSSNYSSSNLLRYEPQVNQEDINNVHGVWKKISGCFTANGDEQYLTIGNFYDDAHTKTELIVPQYDQGTDFAVYVIDSVFTEEVKNPFIPNVFTPNGDTLNEKFVIKDIHFGWWSLTVVNRWGKQVYQSNDYRNTWEGGDLSSGVYYYVLQHRCPGISYKGAVSILR